MFLRDKKSVLVIVDMVADSVTGANPVFNPEELTSNIVRIREACYAADIPVVQLQHQYRRDGLDAPLNEPRDSSGVPLALVEGTTGSAIVPALDPRERDIVVKKHRWHGFFGTELDSVLRSLGAQQIIWVGGFTDCCVSLSVFEGYARDYTAALILDATSCDNPFTHKVAVLTTANWVYDLALFTTDNFETWLRGESTQFWYSGRDNALPFRSEADVELLYGEILLGMRPESPTGGDV